MTKEELERIKVAYHSGLKVQIWFNGNWKNFDAREYSMYKDPFSENRQYRIVGSDYADMAEKRIAELEAQIEKMKVCQNCSNWNWKHNKCEKKLKGDCFKYSKWVMRNF